MVYNYLTYDHFFSDLSDHSHLHEKEREIREKELTKAKEARAATGASEVAQTKEKRLLVTIRSVVIVLALSIHSIFEGMAIGEQQKAFTLKH